jgi:heme-degrading monooxygenase HmoA
VRGDDEMPYLMIHHKVENFNKWKPKFDEHGEKRRAAGSKKYQIFHSADDANNLVLLFEWDSLDNAHAFAESEDLKQKMKEAGVIGEPDIYFLNEGEHTSE